MGWLAIQSQPTVFLFGDFRITVGESDVIPERIPLETWGFVCLVKGQQVVFWDPNVSMSTSTAARVKWLIAVHAPGLRALLWFHCSAKAHLGHPKGGVMWSCHRSSKICMDDTPPLAWGGSLNSGLYTILRTTPNTLFPTLHLHDVSILRRASGCSLVVSYASLIHLFVK